MVALLIGYARCSTDQQDLTVQRDGLLALGVDTARVYIDTLSSQERELPPPLTAVSSIFHYAKASSARRR
ncbi:hypothetical protein BH20ACT6_BH20ACT6_22690 [soil metagenome]